VSGDCCACAVGEGLLLCSAMRGEAGWLERDGFLGLEFFVLSSNVQNCPLSFMCVVETSIYR